MRNTEQAYFPGANAVPNTIGTQLVAGSPWKSPPRAPTDPDVPDSGIRLVDVKSGSNAYTEWTTRARDSG
jgi:hypothetical protein